MQKDLTVFQAKEQYKREAERLFETLDVSAETRLDYNYCIGTFLDYVVTNGFGRNTFLEFKRSLAQRNDMATATKNKYMASARVFLKELNRLGKLPTDVTQNIKSFSQSKKHKRDGLNDLEMKRVVDRLQQLPSSAKTARLKAIIALLAIQGLRGVEVIRLDVKDLDLVGKVCFVRGKGMDDKEAVYLHPESAKVLAEHLKINRLADGPLFASRSNNSKGHRLTTRALRQIVGKMLAELDVNRTVHGFRHYFTTTLISKYKGDLLEVARYTRHRTLEVLQIYNDNINQKADLPRYYEAFKEVSF